ncbi:MAG: DUF2934 domain-containing protein [Lautropia sp.]
MKPRKNSQQQQTDDLHLASAAPASSAAIVDGSTGPSDARPPEDTAVGSSRSADLEQRIREAAYQRYQSRQGGHGDEVTDWLQAEADMTNRSARS